MHYLIKKDKKQELQSGYLITNLAPLCSCSRQYLSDVFNGRYKATREFVEKLIRAIADNSLKMAIDLNQKGMKEMIEYFFEEID